MTRRLLFVFLVVLITGTTAIQAQDWPQFRGQDGSGVATNSDSLPTQWSPNANIAWKAEMPGPGASSPIIVGDKVFVTCYSGYGLDREEPGDMEKLMRHLVCFDRGTGEKLWQTDVKAALPEDPYTGAGIPAHGYASHTPVSDGENVYAFFGKSGVYAYDMDGNELWQQDVGKESDPTTWGSSSSPILHEDTVIITASAESQAVVGLNKKTGEEIWRQEAEGLDGMWGTPSLVEVEDGRTDLVMCVPREMWGLDPESGKLRWHANTNDSRHSYSSLVLEGNKIYAFTGRGGGSIAMEVGGEGDVSESAVVWSGKDVASFASPVQHGAKLYVVASGVLTSVDAKTGERVDRMRLQGAKQTGGRMGSLDYASPVVVGDRMFYLNGSGQMFVFSLGEEIEQVAINQVTNDQETFWGSPAVSDGQMILRSDKHLYCIADKGEEVSADDIAAATGDEPEEAEAGGGRRGGRGGGGGGRQRFDASASFDQMDKDKDGQVSMEELKESRFGEMADRVMTLDKDESKSISKEEFTGGITGLFSQRRGGGGGQGYEAKDTRPDRPKRPESVGDIK